MAKSGRLDWGDNIYGHYKSIFNHCDVIGQQSNRIRRKTQNKGYYAVQGHSQSSRSVPIESRMRFPITDLVLTTYLVPLRSYRSLLFKLWTTWVLSHPLGGLETTYDVYFKLIGKRVVDFLVLIELFSLDVTTEAPRAKINRKSAISLQRCQFDPIFQIEGDVPINHFLHG